MRFHTKREPTSSRIPIDRGEYRVYLWSPMSSPMMVEEWCRIRVKIRNENVQTQCVSEFKSKFESISNLTGVFVVIVYEEDERETNTTLNFEQLRLVPVWDFYITVSLLMAKITNEPLPKSTLGKWLALSDTTPLIFRYAPFLMGSTPGPSYVLSSNERIVNRINEARYFNFPLLLLMRIWRDRVPMDNDNITYNLAHAFSHFNGSV